MTSSESRATPRVRSPKRRIVIGMFLLPLLVLAGSLVAVLSGARVPVAIVGLVTLPFLLLSLPQVWPDVSRRRRTALPVVEDRRTVFEATSADRWSYAALALLLLAAPWLARWDAARLGERLPTQLATWLWLAPPLGVAGLAWQRRWRRVHVALAASGVSVQSHRGVVDIPWGSLPDLDGSPAPRLDHAMAAAGAPIDGHALRGDPETVADALQFYRDTPQARHELADGGVLDRVRRADFESRRAQSES